MAIFRGVGGSGDSSDNSFLDAVTAQANSASASATSAANSLAAIQQTEVTSASFNTGDGVLTLTKTGGATVTADLDGRFLTSYTETNNLTTAVTWADVPDANITETSVTQYLTAANVTSPLTGGTGISVASNGTITNDSPDQTVALTGTGATTITGTYPNFTINSVNTTYTVGDGGLTTNDFTDADHTKLNGIEANATADQTGAEIKSAYEAVADTNAFTDAEKTKLLGIEASADVTDATNVTSAGAAMLASSPTFTGTITAPNVDISTSGSVITNIATGNLVNQGDTKTINLGTGFGQYGTTTVNIGSHESDPIFINGTVTVEGDIAVNGTVDGRDVATDGDKLDTLERVYRTRFRHRESELSTFQSLSVTIADIGNPIYTKSTTGSENTLDFFLATTCSDYYDNNDGNIEVVVTAPNPSYEDVVNLGTVSNVVSNIPQGYFNFDVVGDVTKHLTDYCGLSVNSDGSNAFLYGQVRSNAYYNPSTNKTTISCTQYQANKPVNGDTVYLHPFDWETSGTAIIGNIIQIDEVVYNTQKMSRKDFSAYLGYFKSSVTVKIRGKEASSTSDNIAIRKMEGTLTQVQD